MLDGEETVQIELAESFAGRDRDSMLDGDETMQIPCESFAGRRDTACWTERKSWK